MKKSIFLPSLFAFLWLYSNQLLAQPDQNNSGTNASFSIIDNVQSCMQTFKAGINGTLNQVVVDLETQNCPNALTCKIFDGAPNSSEIASEIITIPINTPRSNISINFTNPATLVSGNTYTILLSANCVSGPGYSIYWYKSVNGAYTNGQAYYGSATNAIQEDPLNDFYFQTFMNGTASLKENPKDEILIYPNPTSSFLHINGLGQKQSVLIKIFDSRGMLILSEKQVDNNNINVSHLPNGLYFIEIISNQKRYAERLIISK